MKLRYALLALLIACTMPTQIPQDPGLQQATFAGGCFWCMEPPFEKLGVAAVISGYSGGTEQNPTYHQVASGQTGHMESVQVYFDPAKVRYEDLLDVFWHNIDPTDAGGQFVDRGKQYRSAIFYHNEEQKQLAEQSKQALEQSGVFDKPIVTQILPYTGFYPAEEYHQDFYKNYPVKYKYYREGSGRDAFLEEHWTMKPSEEELKKMLTPLQYKVTQEEGTEPAFNNEYWNNTKEGIYVDIITGEPLFSSTDKYKSGTGWPSFTKPIDKSHIALREDKKLFVVRTEVRSKEGDNHLGHLFDDGPAPTGQRYCMNSAALRFVPKEDMEKEGYGDYLYLFDTQE